MEKSIFKCQLILAIFMFYHFVPIHADDGLITDQVKINVEKAGTLCDMLSIEQKHSITNLKVSGELNIEDVKFIREMAGSYSSHGSRLDPDGNLQHLDLSDVTFVSGGSFTVYDGGGGAGENFWLEKVNIMPDSIEGPTFALLPNLLTIVLPSRTVKIGKEVFDMNRNLISVTLPSGLVKIDKGAFGGCWNLTSINLPSGLKEIGDYAFLGCENLTSIVLPPDLTEISDGMFSGAGLTSIDIPYGVTRIGYHAFSECKVTSVRLPDSVIETNGFSFSLCENLTSIVLPSSLTGMGHRDFYGCTKLTTIYAYMNVPPRYYNTRYPDFYYPFEFGSNSIMNGVRDNAVLYIPKGSSSAYSKAIDWREFKNIVEFDPTSIESINTAKDIKETSSYTLDGQRLDHPRRGLNIVKYSDGTVRKILVK